MSDAKACGRRTRRAMAASVAIHVLLLSWLILLPRMTPEAAAITEITLLEPGELSAGGSTGPGPASPAAPARPATGSDGKTSAGLAAAHDSDVRFQREADPAPLSPRPQSEEAFADRLEARLAALQHDTPSPAGGAAVAALGPTSMWGSATSVSSTGSGSGGKAPIELNRGGKGGGGGSGRGGGAGEGVGGGRGLGLALTRGGGGGKGAGSQLAVPALPAASAAAASPASERKGTARRDLAGMSLMGPIADRPIVSYSAPPYPEWAKREGVEGSVTLYFVVLPDGRVKENIVVQKTAGFEDFDLGASNALRVWRFEPLRGGRAGEQWGTITIHFRLSDVG